MTFLVLVRHGRTKANADGVLAGWTSGVHLDDTGQQQAERIGSRLSRVPLAAVISSPLERCVATATAIHRAQTEPEPGTQAPEPHTDDRLGECHYGGWTGRRLTDLAREPLWRAVQERPSTVTFPPDPDHLHESLAEMQRRALAAVGNWHNRISVRNGPDAVWVAVSHGDVIKAILADALGAHLDRFQRVVIDPGSASIVQLSAGNPVVLRVNDTGSDPVELGTPRESPGQHGDAVVGGGAGASKVAPCR